MEEQTHVTPETEETAAETMWETPASETAPAAVSPVSTAPESTPEDPISAPAASAPESEAAFAVPPDITHRLAAQFIGMQEEVPGLHAPEDLPAEVWDTAAREGIPIMDAFLRFRWQEEQRIRKEEERRRRAAECSSGSLREGRAESRPEQEAFMRSFRRALR